MRSKVVVAQIGKPGPGGFSVSDYTDQFDDQFGGESGRQPTARVRDEDAEPWELSYAMWNHLGPLIGFAALLGGGGLLFFIPAIIALIMWKARADDSPYIDDHGREAVNFHLSIGVLFVLSIVLAIPTCGVATIVAVFGLPVLGLVGGVMAAIAANKGEYFRYPMTVRLIKPGES